MVTFGFRPDNVKPVSEMAGTPVNQVYIGSCTNGRISDLRIAAKVLAGQRIHNSVRAIVSPATPAVYNQALDEGLIKTFMDAGFCVTNPTCGACLGMSNGVLADGEVCGVHHQPQFQRSHGQGGDGPPDEPGHRRGHGHCRKHRQFPAFQRIEQEQTMKNFSGKVLFLDRSDINTDEIIPAKYLTEISREALAPNLLEDLTLDGFDPSRDIAGKSVVLTRANFGCGSSREHAPWALEVNGINLVVGESYARIFRQNMFNCGMMAVELPADTIDGLFAAFAGRETTAETDFAARTITFSADGKRETIPFSISGFDADLVTAGGWVEYADANY